MKSSLLQIQSAVAGASITADTAFDGVSTDSRAVAAGNLFVALRGERFDAHDFLSDVAQRAAAVVVERLPEGVSIPAMVVPDTRVALGEIARCWREQFNIPLIGVTGSNGKTTVKEMIASILAAAFGADGYLSTRGNLNNEIGVPLTLFRLGTQCRAAVVEMGMNHSGEIAVLSAIAQSTVGLVNNAQREHQEFMESVEAVAKENGSVILSLSAQGTAVFPADDDYTALWKGFAAEKGCQTMTFGFSRDADVRCEWRPNDFGSDLIVDASGHTFDVKLSAAGEHNVRNALAAIACALSAGIALSAIKAGLESFAPVNGRLQRKTAKNGALVIDDTYNANPDSVRAAIDVLANAKSPRLLVLGDMGEVGSEGPHFHWEIGAYAKSRGIDAFFTLGELAAHASQAFGAGGKHHRDIDSLNHSVEQTLTKDATVLVKGSRFMKMERVVQHLVGQPSQETH